MYFNRKKGKYIRKQTHKEALNTVPKIYDLLTEEQTFKNCPREGLEYSQLCFGKLCVQNYIGSH